MPRKYNTPEERRKADREGRRRYNHKYPERRLAARRKWYAKNRAYMLAYMKAYFKKHPEKLKRGMEANRAWIKAHPERMAEHVRRYRIREQIAERREAMAKGDYNRFLCLVGWNTLPVEKSESLPVVLLTLDDLDSDV